MNKLVVVLAGAVVALGPGCRFFYVRPTTDEVVPRDKESGDRGEKLATHIAGCRTCHAGRKGGSILDDPERDALLSGGHFIEDSVEKIVIDVPNITRDKETGIGNMTDDQIMRAIRDGVGARDQFLDPWHFSYSYQFMSDKDVRALTAYLRREDAERQDKPRQKHQMPWGRRLYVSMGWMKHLPARNVPHPDEKDRLAVGKYLAHIGGCVECHSRTPNGPLGPADKGFMGGSTVPFANPRVGKVWASNLTSDRATGLGKYSQEEIKEALVGNKRLDRKPLAPPMSTFAHDFSGMDTEDLNALVLYLSLLPPVKHKVPERQLTPEWEAKLRQQVTSLAP